MYIHTHAGINLRTHTYAYHASHVLYTASISPCISYQKHQASTGYGCANLYSRSTLKINPKANLHARSIVRVSPKAILASWERLVSSEASNLAPTPQKEKNSPQSYWTLGCEQVEKPVQLLKHRLLHFVMLSPPAQGQASSLMKKLCLVVAPRCTAIKSAVGQAESYKVCVLMKAHTSYVCHACVRNCFK